MNLGELQIASGCVSPKVSEIFLIFANTAGSVCMRRTVRDAKRALHPQADMLAFSDTDRITLNVICNMIQ